MDYHDYLSALRRRWRVVLTAVVLAAAAAWLTTAVSPPPIGPDSYTATTVIIDSGSISGSASELGATSLDTVATLANLHPVVQAAADALGYEGTLSELASRVNATADPATPGILRITASSTNRREAALLADTFATELIRYLHESRQQRAEENLDFVSQRLDQLAEDLSAIDQDLAGASVTEANVLEARKTALTNQLTFLGGLYQQYLGTSVEPQSLQIVERATPVPVASTGIQAPRSRTVRVLIGALIGLLGGFAIALMLERSDTRIRTAEVAARDFGAPVLAEIPRFTKEQLSGIVAVDHPRSQHAEAFRLLASSIVQGSISLGSNGSGRDARRPPARGRILLVTSAGPGEGKSSVVANLGVSLAETGQRVMILSCDLRRPTLHEMFEVPNLEGLSDALRHPGAQHVLDGCVLNTRFDGVSIVTSGTAAERPGELLSSERMRVALRDARSMSDFVLIDTAPILTASDGAHLIPHVDAVLVVARAGVVTSALAHRVREVLERLQSPPVGVALTGAQETPMPAGLYQYSRAAPVRQDDDKELGDTPDYHVPEEARRV
jgi:capsular exopolysaccharide synthesis family protein